MSRKQIGLFRRILENLRSSASAYKAQEMFIGQDQFGNQYFEKHQVNFKRSSRYIKNLRPKPGIASLESPEIPHEWNSWLRHRRKNPPTEEELEENYIYILRTQLRVKEMQEKTGTDIEKLPDHKGFPKTTQSAAHKSDFPTYDDLECKPGYTINKDYKDKS